MATFRYAARTLLKSRGFTAVAVATLALGIGANTAVFSLMRAVLFAPLPVADADRIVVLTERRSTSGRANLPISAHEWVAWKEQNRSFDGIGLMLLQRANHTGAGDPEQIELLRVSSDYFAVLGIQAVLGRLFGPGDDAADRIVILSDELWRRRFSADPTVVGQAITLDDQTYSVVGVAPALPRSVSPQAWMPLDVVAHARAVGRHNLNAVARLRPGIEIAAAQADLSTISARLEQTLPNSNRGHGVAVTGLREALVGAFRPALLALLAAAGFVLLIACANVMNLLLTRGATRHRELAVRAALGASRARLLRDLLAESLLVGALGGASGVLLAAWIVDVVPTLQAVAIPLLETAGLDWQAFAAAGVMALATGIGAGLAPALRGAREQFAKLREGDRSSDDRGRRRLRQVLVAAETALALILLAGAGLMINSFVRLTAVDAGFNAERVLVVPINLPAARYSGAVQQRAFYDRVLASLQQIPGVAAVGAVSHLPLGRADNWMPFNVVGRPAAEPGKESYAPFRTATPDYFRAFGIPLIRGRFFRDSDARIAVPLVRWYPQQPYPPGFDTPQAAPVAILSEAAAARYFPGEDPLGKRLRVMFSPDVTIVGIVGNVKHNGLSAPTYEHIYLPHNQEVWDSASFVVKAEGRPSTIAAAVRARVAALDSNLPIELQTMTEVRSESIGEPRLYALLVGCFALVALGLAVVGIFGVVSHGVVQRTREIGIRVALGAEAHEIVRMVVRQGMGPVIGGIAVGVIGAAALTDSIEKLLFEVKPTDPLTFTLVVGLLGAVAFSACWIPARRASRLDPVEALRAG